MTTSKVHCPLPILTDISYEDWIQEVEIWKSVTDLGKKKRAGVVSLTLTGKYREVAREVRVSAMNTDTGLDELIKVLDEHFKKNSIDSSYQCYCEFDNFRNSDESVTQYIQDYKKRYKRVKALGLVYPDAILGCKLPENSGLESRKANGSYLCEEPQIRAGKVVNEREFRLYRFK